MSKVTSKIENQGSLKFIDFVHNNRKQEKNHKKLPFYFWYEAFYFIQPIKLIHLSSTLFLKRFRTKLTKRSTLFTIATVVIKCVRKL